MNGHDIPEDAALVAWLDQRGNPHAADPDGEHWACIVRQRGEPAWVKMAGTGPQGQWTEADDRLPARVYAALVRPTVDPTARLRLTRQLAAQRLAPLQKHLGVVSDLPAVRHLIVLPSPWLAGVPVEALAEAQSKDAPRYLISYAPSGTMFAWLREQRQLKRRGDQADSPRLLALYQPAGVDPPLPFTRPEVLGIAGYFDPKNQVVLRASDASEQRLDDLARTGRLREFDFLHFAVHGAMDPDVAMRSRLSLALDQLPDPLARVLAGQEVYDGELTAEQILRTWKLNAELVTLSACLTALGKEGGGEGFIGFSHALFLVGERSVVLSLWKVEDEATSLLMNRFYANLLGRRAGLSGPMPKAEALREAKEWLRQYDDGQTQGEILAERVIKRPLPNAAMTSVPVEPAPSGPAVSRRFAHPYYWAGFILIGDPD